MNEELLSFFYINFKLMNVILLVELISLLNFIISFTKSFTCFAQY
jgi:hypothetical protein